MRVAPEAWVQAAAGGAVVVGAFGAWGALSAVDEQAEVVRTTRWLLAALGAAAIAIALALRGRRWPAFAAAALFLVAGALGWGESRYESNQAHSYGVDGPTWGLWMVFAGSAIGLAASLVRAWRVPRERAPDVPAG